MSETQWHGSNPYCLVISERGGGVTLIDLDEPGWLKTHADLMRAQGQWILARKKGSEPVCTMLVSEGEQPYYTARVFTAFLPPPDWFRQIEVTVDPAAIKELAQVRAYGIGKERVDQRVDRMWVLPNGVVCAGDDVEVLGHELAKATLGQVIQQLRDRHGSHREEGQGGHQEGEDGQGQAGEGESRPAGPAGHLTARPKAAHRRTQQRPPSRAVASARRASRRGEAGGS